MYQMMQWMTGGFGPFWGWLMFLGMFVITILIIVALVLFIIWLVEQLNKKN